jgi:hypothetical protein
MPSNSFRTRNDFDQIYRDKRQASLVSEAYYPFSSRLHYQNLATIRTFEMDIHMVSTSASTQKSIRDGDLMIAGTASVLKGGYNFEKRLH